MKGIKKNLPAEEYHKIEALSQSGLKEFEKGPHYYAEFLRAKREPTPAMLFGTLVHMAILEPEKFADSVTIVTNKRVTEKDKKTAALEGKIPCTQTDAAKIDRIVAQINKDPLVKGLLSEGSPEVSMFWDREGVPCKARVDWLRDDGVIVDVKVTTSGMSEDSIERTMRKYQYDLQSAWYLEGLKECLGQESLNFIHIFIQPDPYDVFICCLSDFDLQNAHIKIDDIFQKFKECKSYDRPESEIKTIVLKQYG